MLIRLVLAITRLSQHSKLEKYIMLTGSLINQVSHFQNRITVISLIIALVVQLGSSTQAIKPSGIMSINRDSKS